MRLFCFPYAGGGALLFRSWADLMIGDVEICAIQPPGRANRIREKPFTRLLAMVEDLLPAVSPYLDKPFAFFGHSMGAKMSFELVRQLRSRNNRLPMHLFVSGARAPHIPDSEPPLYALNDAELVERLATLNGTPKEVLAHPELMQLMLPLLRADFEVCETYEYEDDAPLDCPISVFGGLYDHKIKREFLEGWRQHTDAGCSVRMFPGDHFFLNTCQSQLLQIISRELLLMRAPA